MSLVERIVAFCCHRPWFVVAVTLILTGGTGYYTYENFAINTDSEQLIDAKVGWRMREARFDAAFPQQNNLTAVVIDGQTPELAEAAAAALSDRLSSDHDHFTRVRRPDGGAFFNRNGLLFLSLGEVQDTTQQLIKAQPFLGTLAADPSLRGIMTSLDTVLLGVGQGQASLADIDAPMTQFARCSRRQPRGKPITSPGAPLITGAKPRPEEIRRFIEVKPKLDFNALEPGRRGKRRDPQGRGATGPHPPAWRAGAPDRTGAAVGRGIRHSHRSRLADDRGDGGGGAAYPVAGAALGAHHQRDPDYPGAGAYHHHGRLGLKAVGVFNIISIAFIALFVGLGGGFRHPVLGALSQRAASPCRSCHRADPYRARAMGVPLALGGGGPRRPASSPSCPPPIPAWRNSEWWRGSA